MARNRIVEEQPIHQDSTWGVEVKVYLNRIEIHDYRGILGHVTGGSVRTIPARNIQAVEKRMISPTTVIRTLDGETIEFRASKGTVNAIKGIL